MASIIIKSNASTTSDVTIGDMGVIIPQAGGTETFDKTDELMEAQQSQDLRDYLTDDAFGANSSTLILNDGSGDIAQSDVLNFLDTRILPRADQDYGVITLDDAGLVESAIDFNSQDLSNVKLANAMDANGQLINGVADPVADTDGVNLRTLEEKVTQGKVWKELVISDGQLDSTNDAISQAIPFYLDGQPTANDTLVIDDGSTTETFTFKAAEAVAFDVGIGVDADTTMTNLAQAINDDSTLWSASDLTNLESINDGSGSTTAGKVVLIYRTNNSTQDSYDDRIYSSGANSTQSLWQYVNYNGEFDYVISTSSQLPSSDPAQKEFGFGRATANLVSNETHSTRNEDYVMVWDSDDGVWQNSGSASINAGNGLQKVGNTISVLLPADSGLIADGTGLYADWGEVGDIQTLGLSASAGTAGEIARADHVHEHGDLSGEAVPTTMHTAEQVAVAGTYTSIGSPADVEEALSNINDLIAAGAGAKDYSFGTRRRVLGGGTRYLANGGGVVGSAAPLRLMRDGTITGASIQVDSADASRAYKLSIQINGSEVASVALGTGVQGAHSVALSQSVSAGDLLRCAIILTSGSGASSFRNAAALVEINYS